MIDGFGFLDLHSACKWASVSSRTFHRWIDRGLRVHRHSPRGKILVRPADIEAFLVSQQKPQPDLNAMVAATLQDLQGGEDR